jgi:hypothetical protein
MHASCIAPYEQCPVSVSFILYGQDMGRRRVCSDNVVNSMLGGPKHTDGTSYLFRLLSSFIGGEGGWLRERLIADLLITAAASQDATCMTRGKFRETTIRGLG